jgi:hypothetical protein
MLHRGSASLSRLVRDLRSEDRGFAVDGRVLDFPVRHFGRTWVRGLSGQRPAHQESAGTKSDVQESQWLLNLHTYGLLNNSFQPASEIRVLRTYWRQRLQHVTEPATCVQRMQKALTQMNIQLANVISDLSGVTGQMIVRAIVAGERDPRKLAQLSHPRIQASRGEIAKSLEGNWRQELIFLLQQEIEMYDTYQRRVAECDQQLQKHLSRFADACAGSPTTQDRLLARVIAMQPWCLPLSGKSRRPGFAFFEAQ